MSLEPRHELLVREILGRHVADREVWAFGSRVAGRPRRYSDLDLVILGGTPLPPRARSKLAEAFEESDLPFRVDVLEWATLDEGFRQIIRAGRQGKPPADTARGELACFPTRGRMAGPAPAPAARVSASVAPSGWRGEPRLSRRRG